MDKGPKAEVETAQALQTGAAPSAASSDESADASGPAAPVTEGSAAEVEASQAGQVAEDAGKGEAAGEAGAARRGERARRRKKGATGDIAKKAEKSEKTSKNSDWADLVAGRTPLTFLLIIVGLLMAFAWRGIRQDSPTEDEWAHLVRGIGYYQTRDMRMHVQHPPLANLLDGLPSAFDQNPDVTQMKTWQEGYAPGLEYIRNDYEHARAQLFRGRYVATLFFLGLVVYAFYFCLSMFGWPTAAAAAALLAFNPTLIGQARYVATDMPVTTFAVIATGELARYLIDKRRIYTLALALAGLVLSKHSGIVLLGMVVFLAFLAACFGRGFFRDEASFPKRLLRWLGHFALAGAIVLLAINVVYKFDRTFMTVSDILSAPEPQHWVTKNYKGEMLEQRSPLPRLPGELRIPLPYSYLFGLFAVQEQNRGGYPTYFMGVQSHDGNPWYFPVLLLTKNPPATLALLAIGVFAWLRLRKRKTPERAGPGEAGPGETVLGLSIPTACFLAMSVLFLAFIMRSRLNMGVRHGIPVMALCSVLAGRAFAHGLELFTSRNARIALTLVTFSGVASALISGPHYLNYYNVFALGRGSWINVVGDDWGQDRAAFVKFVKQRGLEPLYYHTQTPTRKLEVDYLGLAYRELNCKTKPEPGSWVAIHAQYVHRFEATPNCVTWMRGLTPVYKFNENVWVYKIPEKS
ncbi:MAG: phospholipid carrier-dependent glycosyltransferase [Myxococcota bacterium]